MLCHFLISQNDNLNTKVIIMSRLSTEVKERLLEKKMKLRKRLQTLMQGRMFWQTMLVHFYFKDNENLPHLTSMFDPSCVKFNSCQNRTRMQCMGKSAVMMNFHFIQFTERCQPVVRSYFHWDFTTCCLFNIGSQSSRAREGHQIPVLPAN